MFALPAGLQLGWLLYERARALTGAASHISGWISLLLSDVDGEVRVLLEQLVQRVDALTPPLTFALSWASDKGSAVSDVVFAAKSQLFRVEQFIHQCTRHKGQVKLVDRDWLIRNLHSHLRELDFAIHSVTLCVSLIGASRPQQPHSAVVSASALLRASDRLQSMHAQGGDVTCSFGALYTLSSGDGSAGLAESVEEAAGGWEGADEEEVGSEARSTLPLSASTFLTDYDHFSANPDSKQRGAERESLQPDPPHAAPTSDPALLPARASARLSSPVSPFTHRAPTRPAPVGSGPVCDVRGWLNESVLDIGSDGSPEPAAPAEAGAAHDRPLFSAVEPPLSTRSADQPATWKRIWPAASLKIYRNTARNVYELHVENLAADPALVDGELLSSPSLSSSSARRLRFDLSSSLAFRCTNSRALGLAEDEAAKLQSSALLDVCFHWCSQWVSRVQCQYAFMLLDIEHSAQTRLADGLRPIDIAYAARLCCYENQTTRPQHSALHNQSARLFHVQATDEELWLLFADHATHAADEQSEEATQRGAAQASAAFPPAVLASQPASSAPPYASSSSSSSSSSQRSVHASLSAGSSPPLTSLRSGSTPPLDSSLSFECGLAEPPSPVGPLPARPLSPRLGVHSLRSISTSGRRAMASSFSDLPHFASAARAAAPASDQPSSTQHHTISPAALQSDHAAMHAGDELQSTSTPR